MKVQCPNCKTRYKMSGSKTSEKESKVICPKCLTRFSIMPDFKTKKDTSAEYDYYLPRNKKFVSTATGHIPQWGAWILIFVGALLLMGGVWWFVDTQRFLAKAQSSPGIVIDLIEIEDAGTAPKVRFREKTENSEIVFVSKSSSSPPAHRKGQSVTVFYEPKNPENATIGGFYSLWLFPTVFSFVGAMSLIYGLGLVISRSTRHFK